MRIVDLKARVLRIPRLSTLTTSYGSAGSATTVLVEIASDEGPVGYGQAGVDAPSYGETAQGIIANLRAHLAPAVIGQDPRHVTALERRLHAALPHHWFAISAVEMALWDLVGKIHAVPVWQLLGGAFATASRSWDSSTTTSRSRWLRQPPARSTPRPMTS